VAAVVTFLLTFVMRWVAPRIGAIAMPGPRSIHTRPTPSLGGAAMFVGFLVAMAVASRLDQFHEIFADNTEPLGLLLAGGVMFVVGAIDDLREVSPPAKIAGQVLSGSILSLLGVTMLYFRVPFASYEYVVLSPDLAPLVTVLTVVVMANAIHLIDGLDGLACGIVMIAGAAMFLYADRLFKAGLLEARTAGAGRRSPSVSAWASSRTAGWRIFMGDAGAMFWSLLLATTITVGGRTADPFSGQTYFCFARSLPPLVILGSRSSTPCSRSSGAGHAHSFARPTTFLHHRLMRMGHGPRGAVLILGLWTALLSAVVLLPTFTERGNSLVPLAVGALALLLYIYFHPGVRSLRAEGAEAADAADGEPPPGSGEVVELEPRRAARRAK
jgi:UDP-GlcNAc:undecaprenyl-phosphate GlcNAc-1-phosphate transferase